MRQIKEKEKVLRLVLTPQEYGPRLQYLAALAMRPELLLPEQLRSIRREFEALKARAH